MNKNYVLIFINIILMSCQSTQYQQRSIANIPGDEHEQVSFSFSPDQSVSNCNNLQEIVDDMNILGMEAELTCMVETKSSGWFGLGATSKEVVGEINIEKAKNGCIEGLPAMFLNGRESLNLQGNNVKFHYNSMYLDVCEPAIVKPEKRFAKTAKMGGDGKLYFPRYNKKLSEEVEEYGFYYKSNLFIREDSPTSTPDERTLSLAESLWLAQVYESLLNLRLVRSGFSGVYSHKELLGPEHTKGVFIGKSYVSIRFSTRLGNNKKTFKYLKSIDEFIKLGTTILLPKSDVADLSEVNISQDNKCKIIQSDVNMIVSQFIGTDTDIVQKVLRHRPTNNTSSKVMLEVRSIDTNFKVSKSNLIQFKSSLDIVRPSKYDREKNQELIIRIDTETRLIKDQETRRFKCDLSINYSDSRSPNKVYKIVRGNYGLVFTYLNGQEIQSIVLENTFNLIHSRLNSRLTKK